MLFSYCQFVTDRIFLKVTLYEPHVLNFVFPSDEMSPNSGWFESPSDEMMDLGDHSEHGTSVLSFLYAIIVLVFGKIAQKTNNKYHARDALLNGYFYLQIIQKLIKVLDHLKTFIWRQSGIAIFFLKKWH